MTAPRLHTIPQVAELLGCSRWHVYDLIARGELDVVDISTGRRACSRVPDDSLAAYITARRRNAKRLRGVA